MLEEGDHMLVLAGDIGGTSTRLAYFSTEGENLTLLVDERYPSRKAGSLKEIVSHFTGKHRLTAETACFGIAGPARSGTVRTPNLPWSVNAEELAQALGIPKVQLINDMEAHLYGIDLLGPENFEVLNRGVPNPTGAIALVSAGTGLGEAIAYRDGTARGPCPGEGGHADFAPRNEIETELLLYLRDKYGRVSNERVLSGPGLHNIYLFLRDVRHLPESPEVAEELLVNDPPAVITKAALAGRCPLCGQVLDLFVSLYGAEAGNAALRYLATGGIYLGGGIAPKIIERLKGPGFMLAFTSKGRMSPLLETIPVMVILNEQSALLGAGRCAARRKEKES